MVAEEREHGPLVEAYRASNSVEARLIREMLEDAGIAVAIDEDWVEGALSIGWPTAPRIMVEESQAERARAIIEAARSSHPPRTDEPSDDVPGTE